MTEPTLDAAFAGLSDYVNAVEDARLPELIGLLARLQALAFQRLLIAATSRQDRLLPMAEVAKILGINVRRAYEMARKGQLPTATVGDRGVRVSQRRLDEYIRKQERK